MRQELIDDIRNLRPLNWMNNDSKGADFPSPFSHLSMFRNQFSKEDLLTASCALRTLSRIRSKRSLDGA